jgi:hypothetical protein
VIEQFRRVARRTGCEGVQQFGYLQQRVGSRYRSSAPIWFRVVVGGSQLVLVLEAVMRLDGELARVLGCADFLATTIESSALAPLRSAIARAVAAASRVRTRVLASARDAAFDLQEPALRSRITLVAVLLAELGEAELELDDPAELRVRDVSNRVLERIGRVNAAWLSERRTILDAGLDQASTRRALYVAADSAEHAFAAIGRDPELVRFLDRGTGAVSTRFRNACHTLAMVFALRDAEPIPVLPRLRRTVSHIAKDPG